MEIRINSDNHIKKSDTFSNELEQSLTSKLDKFSSHITTIEVFLSDENSSKGGANDKKCIIEARLEGLAPLASNHWAGTLREAFQGASTKIERILKDTIERRRKRSKSSSELQEPKLQEPS